MPPLTGNAPVVAGAGAGIVLRRAASRAAATLFVWLVRIGPAEAVPAAFTGGAVRVDATGAGASGLVLTGAAVTAAGFVAGAGAAFAGAGLRAAVTGSEVFRAAATVDLAALFTAPLTLVAGFAAPADLVAAVLGVGFVVLLLVTAIFAFALVVVDLVAGLVPRALATLAFEVRAGAGMVLPPRFAPVARAGDFAAPLFAANFPAAAFAPVVLVLLTDGRALAATTFLAEGLAADDDLADEGLADDDLADEDLTDEDLADDGLAAAVLAVTGLRADAFALARASLAFSALGLDGMGRNTPWLARVGNGPSAHVPDFASVGALAGHGAGRSCRALPHGASDGSDRKRSWKHAG